MERKEVIVSEQELARQKEFTRKMREMNDRRTRTPLALVDTFGCQQNVADGEVLMGMLREMGYELTRDENQADVILLNTCAIREHAEKRVYGHLGRLSHTKAAKPDQIICLCGCMAQQKVVADKVKNSYHHVDLVLGPQAEWRLPELLHEVYTKNKRVFSIENEHGRIAEDLPIVREGGVRAWVSIMYGCNNFCSYCIVPYVRGRERSREPEKIIEDILPGLTGPGESVVICDRREAIGWVLKNSRPKDVIVLCGKGHETYQEVCGEKRHMDERELVAAYTNG